MTLKALAYETTHFMTVQLEDGSSKEYIRTVFGEWCETVQTNSPDNLKRVGFKLAFQLEYLFHNATITNYTTILTS